MTITRRSYTVVMLSILLIAPAVAGPDDIPAPVKETARDLLGKGAKLQREVEGGQVGYQASATTRIELALTAAGALAETEVTIPVRAVPAVALAAAQARVPRGTAFRHAEVILTPAGVVFELEARVGGGELEVTVDGAGKVLGEEREGDDQEGDDADDE